MGTVLSDLSLALSTSTTEKCVLLVLITNDNRL